MNDGCQPYMLDTYVFNHVLDGKISFASLVGRRLVVIRVQAAELRATRNTLRRKRLLAVFEVVNPSIQYASSFAWNIDRAGGMRLVGTTEAEHSRGCLHASRS